MKKLLVMLVALFGLTAAAGCMYPGATWNAKTGSMFVTKSGLNGIMRGVYECKPDGTSFNCQEAPDKP
jgi:hypothetical protein